MATLQALKQAHRQKAEAVTSLVKQELSNAQYSTGYDLMRDLETHTYRDFIVPQLSRLLKALVDSRGPIAVLEIGPGPESILGFLGANLRRKVKRYGAIESNDLFASKLENSLRSTPNDESILPSLERSPKIDRAPFTVKEDTEIGVSEVADAYDVVLFCHSMYGMKSKRRYMEKALKLLVKLPEKNFHPHASRPIVIVFHRDGALHLDGLVCQQTASFPTGVVRVADSDKVLDGFASFIAGFTTNDVDEDSVVRTKWREECRSLGRRETTSSRQLIFSAPNIMAVFDTYATALAKLTNRVPLDQGLLKVKNRVACHHQPAAIVRPTTIEQVLDCVEWAFRNRLSLTVVGGSHSDQCLWPNVVAVDMGAFNKVHIVPAEETGGDETSDASPLVVVEAGCKVGDVIRDTMAAGITVPLGSRPSVGAGMWLQGGIGHMARLHGLSCDSIVGAVVVSVRSCRVVCIGRVPKQHQPLDAFGPENEEDSLWALKGAGTNFGIVVSVTFKSCAAPKYLNRNWVIRMSRGPNTESQYTEARSRISQFGGFSRELPQDCAADAYLYADGEQLVLGVGMYEISTAPLTATRPTIATANKMWGPEATFKVVDGVGLFETEMYMSEMHGGHSGGTTSSFKRCMFLDNVEDSKIVNRLLAAFKTRPSELCYLHLLQGGGAVGDVAPRDTAFGCRRWNYACVITGVWPRGLDGTDVARAAVRWVYSVARGLLRFSVGAYGADLGPDPRDAFLATKAFGPNRTGLTKLKSSLDPHNILTYACPLLESPKGPKLVILVTGESWAGKDYCAEVWVSAFNAHTLQSGAARVVSISNATKQAYAASSGAEFNRLLKNRAYKEQHRPALTKIYQDQVRQRPRLPEENFVDLVSAAADVDVLVITGMRDEAPVASFSHLAPDSKVIEVNVQTSEKTILIRKGHQDDSDEAGTHERIDNSSTTLKHHPGLVFNNDKDGDTAARKFAEDYLFPHINESLEQLAKMVRCVPDFPSEGCDFRDVLGISQRPGGLNLCISRLENDFTGDWTKVDAIAACEAGGFVFASALAPRVKKPLVLLRKGGKLPMPVVRVDKLESNISSLTSDGFKKQQLEMERGVVPRGSQVVVVDDVLASGKTLCAVLELLGRDRIEAENISVMVVAEFPAHRGRELLRQRGFGKVNVQNLLVYGGK